MFTIRRSVNWLKLTKYLAGIVILNAVIYGFSLVSVKADTIDWTTNDPTARVRDDLPAPTSEQEFRGCVKQNVHIGSFWVDPLTRDNICVYQADGFRYGILDKFVRTGTYSGYQDTAFVISFPGDGNMYRVDGMPTSAYSTPLVPIQGSKHIVFRAFRNSGSPVYNLNIIKNLPSKLTRIISSDLSTSYKLDDDAIEPLLKNERGEPVGANAVNASTNGKWLAVELRTSVQGLVRIDMETFEYKRFSNYGPTYGQGSNGSIEFAVSDDGRYIATTGHNVVPWIYDLDGNCGLTQSIFQSESSSLSNPCPDKYIHSFVNDAIGGDIYMIGKPKFDALGGELTVRVSPQSHTSVPLEEKWVTLTAHGYDNTPRLDYLALGDSYSSGEGDTEVDTFGHKYYRDKTDITEDFSKGRPKEKCHISTRSYPYLLARNMNLALDSPKEWDTVTCSGAVIWDVQDQAHEAYGGQNNRLLSYDTNSLKTQALNEFIPGRQKQVEFVKKYKPKVITLTMGGNDVDFAGKIEKCAKRFDTCEFADLSWRTKLKIELTGKFNTLKSLYSELRDVTNGQSRIYVLGYPQFINAAPDAPCTNTYNLNSAEREMIANSVTFFNNIIEQAAIAAGVKYVDTENSFGNHRLCDDNTQHVTAITNIFGLNQNESQESFHPNAEGHRDIATAFSNALHGQSPLTYTHCSGTIIVCPDSNATLETIELPDYFKVISPEEDKIVTYYPLSNGILVKSQDGHISLSPYTGKSGSNFDATIYSDPVSLGSIPVAEDGSVNANITIPNSVPAGFHTLVLTGQTYSGEPIEIYQVIEVRGPNPNDIDEDGINDSTDRCAYIQPLNQDKDFDGIDDACDPIINSTKQVPGSSNYNSMNQQLSYSNRSNDNNTSTNSDSQAVSNRVNGNTSEKSDTYGRDAIRKPEDIMGVGVVTIVIISIAIIVTLILVVYMKRRGVVRK